jgi:hypothetical protein
VTNEEPGNREIPISVADITARVGAGEYRVSAYGFELQPAHRSMIVEAWRGCC